MTDNFFKDLPSFDSFADACNPEHYYPAPADWFIVITDVKGSTQAINDGRYKDVNMVGAACIAAAVNTCKGVEIPYVFGGDGATFLIPPQYIDSVKQELSGVKAFAETMHGLTLRLGAIPIKEIAARGQSFDVAKFSMPTGFTLAMFGGGGALLADDLLKKDEQFFIQDTDTTVDPNLYGLSCRWHPIAAKRGVVMTLLVHALSTDMGNIYYRKINDFIAQVLDADSSPVHSDNLVYRWPSIETLRQSMMVWKQGNVVLKLFEHVFLISLINIMNRFNINLPKLDFASYKKDMITNSDYRKFDGMLRMVVDCSEEQAATIEAYLQNMRQNGQIAYGIHYSDSALMTCYVQSLANTGHIHFIDGSDGGYALAAKQLKQQMLEQVDGALKAEA